MEYLEKKEIDRRDLPALRKILVGPSLESIERVVNKRVGRGHPLFKKICIYLGYQHSSLDLREMGEYFGMQRSAISQSSRRFAETIKGNQELRKVLGKIEKEDLLNVAA
jgi:hypothetical protein